MNSGVFKQADHEGTELEIGTKWRCYADKTENATVGYESDGNHIF